MEIHDSIQRIVDARDKLGVMFYEHFLTNYPEVQRQFQYVDLSRQSILLVTALMIIERHSSHPTAATEQYLQYLGTRHHDFQVPKDVYGIWVKAMLETMQQFHGEEWTSSLENQWRQALRLKPCSAGTKNAWQSDQIAWPPPTNFRRISVVHRQQG